MWIKPWNPGKVFQFRSINSHFYKWKVPKIQEAFSQILKRKIVKTESKFVLSMPDYSWPNSKLPSRKKFVKCPLTGTLYVGIGLHYKNDQRKNLNFVGTQFYWKATWQKLWNVCIKACRNNAEISQLLMTSCENF